MTANGPAKTSRSSPWRRRNDDRPPHDARPLPRRGCSVPALPCLRPLLAVTGHRLARGPTCRHLPSPRMHPLPRSVHHSRDHRNRTTTIGCVQRASQTAHNRGTRRPLAWRLLRQQTVCPTLPSVLAPPRIAPSWSPQDAAQRIPVSRTGHADQPPHGATAPAGKPSVAASPRSSSPTASRLSVAPHSRQGQTRNAGAAASPTAD